MNDPASNTATGNTQALIVEHDSGVLTLTLNRPESSNSLTPVLVESMINALSAYDSVRLCVIKSKGKNFCAGFDLSDLENLTDGDLLLRFVRLETLLQLIHHAPFSVLVLVQGHAVGAGADIIAASGQRVAASNATFRMPGWQFGLALGTRRLSHLIGADAARDLLIDTKVVNATEALQIGLITDITEQQDWSALTATVAKRSSTLPQAAQQKLLNLTVNDTRDADMSALAESASVPGLKQRILDYRQRLKMAKKK